MSKRKCILKVILRSFLIFSAEIRKIPYEMAQLLLII